MRTLLRLALARLAISKMSRMAALRQITPAVVTV